MQPPPPDPAGCTPSFWPSAGTQTLKRRSKPDVTNMGTVGCDVSESTRWWPWGFSADVTSTYLQANQMA
jgi:hypothetical protein